MSDPITLRAYRDGDEHAIIACYNKIFPTGDGKIPPRTLARWRWLYLENPVGIVHHVVAEHEELGVVGGYASIPVRIHCQGEIKLATQNSDLMVLPEWRRHGARPGLFVQLGYLFYELFCGTGPGKALFCYGWPVPAWRMGQAYLKYWNIRDWDLLFREAGPGGFPPRATSATLATREVAQVPGDVDALHARLAGTWELALVRDEKYLSWRYARCPDRKYRILECREVATGSLRGLAVYTVGDLIRPHTSFLVDWLVPADDHDAAAALVAAAERQAGLDGTGVLATIFNHVDPRFLPFQRLGFQLLGTSYFIVVASFFHDTYFFREKWYYTMGDSDLV
jgi:hypothetical protein